MKIKAVDLPETAKTIAEIVGAENTIKLSMFGKQYKDLRKKNAKRSLIYVPKKFNEQNKLIEVIGEKATRSLCREFGGEVLSIPVCTEIFKKTRDELVLSMLKMGFETREIMRIISISQRNIIHIKNKKQKEEKVAIDLKRS